MTIAIVDLGISNIASVLRALDLVGAPLVGKAEPSRLGDASAIILPGVGAFGEGMAVLRKQGLADPLRAAARAGVPILGVCLGMQLLAETSEEHGLHEGLGLVAGHVRRLPETDEDRVPNIGWCDVAPSRPGTLFPTTSSGCFYHVHSFHFVPTDPACVAATMRFAGQDIVVAIETGNVFGVQFHPEKSQDEGLLLLGAFLQHLRASGRIN